MTGDGSQEEAARYLRKRRFYREADRQRSMRQQIEKIGTEEGEFQEQPGGGLQGQKMDTTWAAEPAAEIRRLEAQIVKIEAQRDELRRHLDDLQDALGAWKWDYEGGRGRCRMSFHDKGNGRIHRVLTKFLEDNY